MSPLERIKEVVKKFRVEVYVEGDMMKKNSQNIKISLTFVFTSCSLHRASFDYFLY